MDIATFARAEVAAIAGLGGSLNMNWRIRRLWEPKSSNCDAVPAKMEQCGRT